MTHLAHGRIVDVFLPAAPCRAARFVVTGRIVITPRGAVTVENAAGQRWSVSADWTRCGVPMTLQATMAGPDGQDVTAYKRSRAQVRAGDWLPELGAHAVTDAIADPDDGAHWLTLDDGRDVRVTTRKVWIWRRYTLAGWQRTPWPHTVTLGTHGTRYVSPAHRFPRVSSPARPAPRSGAISYRMRSSMRHTLRLGWLTSYVTPRNPAELRRRDDP
jgi:hypothetical protein